MANAVLVPQAAHAAAGSLLPAAGQEEQQVQADALKEERVRTAIQDLLSEGGMEQVSLRKFKKMLARKLGVHKGQMNIYNDFVKACVKEFWAPAAAQESPAERVAALVEALGGEAENSKQPVHFVTMTRVLPDTLAATDLVDITGMTRQQTLVHVLVVPCMYV